MYISFPLYWVLLVIGKKCYNLNHIISLELHKFVWSLILTLLWNITSALSATGKIEGYVLNLQGIPISNLHVILSPSKLADITDVEGYFVIENVRPGIYTLKFDHIGFKTKIIKNIKIQGNEVLKLDRITLEPKVINLDEIVVTATRTDRRIYDISHSINVVSESTIKERNAKTTAEALREEPGIFVQKTSHGGGSAIIRGLSSNQILILVDGIRLNNSTYRLGNHQYLTTVDNFVVGQLEVVRGPTSVLYGSDALGGTINLLTKKPNLQRTNFNVDYGIIGRYASADEEKTVRTEISLDNYNFAFQIGFSYKDYGDLKRGENSDYPQLEKSTNGLKQTPILLRLRICWQVPMPVIMVYQL